MFQASEVYIFDLMLSIFQSYIVDNLTVVHYRRKVDVLGYSFAFSSSVTLFESENERHKIEPVPIPLPKTSRNFPNVKTRNENLFHNWTSEIIPFIRFGMQMDGT